MGKRCGYGTIVYKDKTEIVGNFENGLPYGKITKTTKAFKFSGFLKRGEYLETIIDTDYNYLVEYTCGNKIAYKYAKTIETFHNNGSYKRGHGTYTVTLVDDIDGSIKSVHTIKSMTCSHSLSFITSDLDDIKVKDSLVPRGIYSGSVNFIFRENQLVLDKLTNGILNDCGKLIAIRSDRSRNICAEYDYGADKYHGVILNGTLRFSNGNLYEGYFTHS